MRISDWSSDVCSSDLGYPADHLQDLADAPAITLQAADDVCRAGDLVAHVGDGGDGAAHHRFALLGGMVGGVGGLRGFGGMPREFLGGRGHLEIGRAPCWERVCQDVYIPVVAVKFNKKNTRTGTRSVIR